MTTTMSPSGLHLYCLSERRCISGGNDQIAPLRGCGIVDDLPDRTRRIDNGRSCRIGHEGRQRLQGAAAVHAIRQREHVFLVRLEPGYRRLEHLNQPLVEQRDAGWRLSVLLVSRRERKMGDLTGDTE